MSNMDSMELTGGHQMTAAEASAADRLTFIRKTYSLVLLGVAVFAGTVMAAQRVPAVWELCKGLYALNPIVLILLLLGSAVLVRVLARTPGIGLIGYLVYAVFLGLIIAPAVAIGAQTGTAAPAAIMTLCVFGGLTAYVFVTKQDFSWMGGALAIGLFAMIGIALCGWLFGFQLGVWYSIAGALLFSGYILYDTSNILHRWSTDKPLPAAIELFVDIVMLFWYILSIFNND